MQNTNDYITLAKASRLIPGRPSLSSAHRWATRGINGVRLQTIRIGGRLFTTEEWTSEFIEAQQNATVSHLEADVELAAEGL